MRPKRRGARPGASVGQGGSFPEHRKISVLGAYRSGELRLPPGYYLQFDPDILFLRRQDGSLAGAFSAAGATPTGVGRAAAEDYRASGRHSA